jgi:hypothetical protein
VNLFDQRLWLTIETGFGDSRSFAVSPAEVGSADFNFPSEQTKSKSFPNPMYRIFEPLASKVKAITGPSGTRSHITDATAPVSKIQVSLAGYSSPQDSVNDTLKVCNDPKCNCEHRATQIAFSTCNIENEGNHTNLGD